METHLIHARLPAELVRKADSYVLRELYSSRTELISDALRRRLEELEGGQESETTPSPVELEKREGTEPNTPPLAPSARADNHEVIANGR